MIKNYMLLLFVFFMVGVHALHANNLDNYSMSDQKMKAAIKNYVISFVTEINGEIVKLNNGTVYKTIYNYPILLQVGDEVIRCRRGAAWNGFPSDGIKYSLKNDIGISFEGILLIQDSEPYMHKIMAVNIVEEGIIVTLEDESIWIVDCPRKAGDWSIRGNWKIGDFVLISTLGIKGAVMDNLTDLSTSTIQCRP